MKIRHKYQAWGGDWYASVEADDGRIMELRADGLTDAQIFASVPLKEPDLVPEETKPKLATISIILDGRETMLVVSEGSKIDITAGKITDASKPIEEGKLRCCACGYPFEGIPDIKRSQKLFFTKEMPDDSTLFLDGFCFFHEKCFVYYSENPELWLAINKFALPWPEKI